MVHIGINCLYLLLLADNLYNNSADFTSMYSAITMSIVSVVMFIGRLCTVALAEHYLLVKNIENDTKLQIHEVNLRYNYNVQLSEDMDKVRKLSHDIKSHLLALW